MLTGINRYHDTSHGFSLKQIQHSQRNIFRLGAAIQQHLPCRFMHPFRREHWPWSNCIDAKRLGEQSGILAYALSDGKEGPNIFESIILTTEHLQPSLPANNIVNLRGATRLTDSTVAGSPVKSAALLTIAQKSFGAAESAAA